MNYKERIQSNLEELTKGEKRVADFIISSDKKASKYTLHDIKKATDVGDATIIRFAQKLGYTGFSDLKIAIASYDFSNEDTISNSSIVSKVEKSLINAITETSFLTSEHDLAEAVNYIRSAKRIFIFGVGASGLSALDMESRFLRSGIRTNCITDSHFQAMNASLMHEGDLVIAFTLTGQTKDICEALAIAKVNDAKIITITNYIMSEAAKLSDIVIRTAIEESILEGGSLTGKISQLFVTDALITYYDEMYLEGDMNSREKIARSIINKQY